MPVNIAELNEAIAKVIPTREAIVFRNNRFSYAELASRSRKLANFLSSQGLGLTTEREFLENWQSGQDHVGLYLYNGNEYIESVLGTLKARAAPFNVNYRYVSKELNYLLEDANTKAIIYHACFAPVLAEVLSLSSSTLSKETLLIQVDDSSEQSLLPGAHDYESVLATSSDKELDLKYSEDDLSILYTGGTTGMPKGVLWRQTDVLATLVGGTKDSIIKFNSIEALVTRASKSKGIRYLPTPPFMHGTALWNALSAICGGNTIVIQNNVVRLEAPYLLDLVESESINVFSLVGDAFGRPVLSELERKEYDLSSLTHILNSGAALSSSMKEKLLKMIPSTVIVDTIGASETGPQAVNISKADTIVDKNRYQVTEDNVVLSEDKTEFLKPGHAGTGWLAKSGIVPLGYLNDREKTTETFPVIGGVRYSLPGDRVRLLDNGDLEFRGRNSGVITSGGEKIFAEEVEKAIGNHINVTDVVVSSRPSERWGNEVIAIVETNGPTDKDDILEECKRHISRYKLPKEIVFVDDFQRGPNGKVDYQWAKRVALESTE